MFNKREYDYRYTKEHYKRIALNVHKEEYEQIQSHCKERKENITQFIKRAIFNQIANDQKE